LIYDHVFALGCREEAIGHRFYWVSGILGIFFGLPRIHIAGKRDGMNIREERPSDREAIETLTCQAFENHPHHEPGAKPTEHLIINRLRESGALTLSIVAEEGGEIIGQITFSSVTINGRASDWFGLGPVSVRPEHQGKGIGGQLIRDGLARLKAQGAEGVVLLGEPEYYGRFGFKANPAISYPGVPAEYFLVLPLHEDSAMPVAEVGYHKAFG